MKKLLTILILLPILSLALYGQNWKDVKGNGTTISVPENWIVANIDQNNVSYIVYVTNKDGIPSGENLNLASVNVGMNLNEASVSVTLDSTLAYLKTVYENVELIEKGSDYIFFNGTTQGMNLTQKLKAYYKGSTLYTLTFTVFQGTFDEFEETFTQIEDSFEYQ